LWENSGRCFGIASYSLSKLQKVFFETPFKEDLKIPFFYFF